LTKFEPNLFISNLNIPPNTLRKNMGGFDIFGIIFIKMSTNEDLKA
jgi:hypothetical protein